MNRCIYCGGRIWPWQHRGWMKRLDGEFIRWHSACYRRIGW